MPTRATLECILNLNKNEKFKRVKVFLVDEEVQRTMEFVVGTPFMIIYFNGKPIQLRFSTGIPTTPTSSTNVYNGQLTREKVEYIVTSCLNKVRNVRKDVQEVIVDINMDQLNVKQVEVQKDDGFDLTDSEDDTSSGEDTAEEEQDEDGDEKAPVSMSGSFVIKRKASVIKPL